MHPQTLVSRCREPDSRPDDGRPLVLVEAAGALWLEDCYLRAGRVAPAVVVGRASSAHLSRVFVTGGPLAVLCSPFAELLALADVRLHGGGLCNSVAAVAGEHCALTVSAWTALPVADIVIDALGHPAAGEKGNGAGGGGSGRGRSAVGLAATVRLRIEDTVFTDNAGASMCVDDQEHCDFDWDFGLDDGGVGGGGGEHAECASRRLSPQGWRTQRVVDYTPLLRPQHSVTVSGVGGGGDGGGTGQQQVELVRTREAAGGAQQQHQPCVAQAPSGLCLNRPAHGRATHNLAGLDDLCHLAAADGGQYDGEEEEEEEEWGQGSDGRSSDAGRGGSWRRAQHGEAVGDDDDDDHHHRPLMARATVGASLQPSL